MRAIGVERAFAHTRSSCDLIIYLKSQTNNTALGPHTIGRRSPVPPFALQYTQPTSVLWFHTPSYWQPSLASPQSDMTRMQSLPKPA
jgi:hypothetical protein